MAKKFILNIAHNLKLSINPNINFRSDKLEFTLDAVNVVSKICWMIFFLLLLSSTLYSSSTNTGTYFFVAIILIIQLGLHVIRRLLSNNEMLPSVANDLYFLIFTSLIALSLFINTILYKDLVNIWGGKDFRAISGVSIISFWFVYFLISYNFSTKDSFKSLHKLLSFGYLISFVIGLIALGTFPISLMNIYALSNLGFLVLILTQKKLHIINIINFLVSTLFLLAMPAGMVQMIVFAFYFSVFIYILIRKFKTLGLAFEELNNKKFEYFEYLKRNYLTLLFIVSIIFSLLGVLWFSRNYDPFFFDKFSIGLKTIKFSYINNLLIGNGLLLNYGSIFFQFLSTYGVIPFIGFVLLTISMFKDCYTYIKSSSISKLGINLYYFSILAPILLYLIFENTGIDILMVVMVVIFTFISIQKQLFILGKEIAVSNVVLKFDGIRKDNSRFFLNFLRILAILFILISCFYLLSNLNYINIFINS